MIDGLLERGKVELDRYGLVFGVGPYESLACFLPCSSPPQGNIGTRDAEGGRLILTLPCVTCFNLLDVCDMHRCSLFLWTTCDLRWPKAQARLCCNSVAGAAGQVIERRGDLATERRGEQTNLRTVTSGATT